MIERARSREHGDFACNVAMLLAKPAQRQTARTGRRNWSPRCRPTRWWTRSRSPARASSIFSSPPARAQAEVRRILDEGDTYGRNTDGAGRTVGVEFVSANPTGPLHVGHGRAAAIGDCLSRAARRHRLERHARVLLQRRRRADRQPRASRCRRAHAASRRTTARWPENGYRGDYIADVARAYLTGQPW